MNPKNLEKILPDAELDIMRVIWHSDRLLCANEITRILNDEDGRGWKTATTHVLINRLEDRGYISADRSGYVHRYAALVSEEEYQKIESKSFLKRICGGSVKHMIASLIDTNSFSEEELDEIADILDGKRKERRSR